MQFLDVKTDYAFKKVFGSEQSKPILLSFLNALLDFNGEHLTDLTIVDPYQIPLLKGMKDTYVDVKATLSNQTQVIIEMQVLQVEGFEKRILYNAAKAYSKQLNKGQDYTFLNPIIALTVTDFTMFNSITEVSSGFQLLEKTHLINYSDDVQLVFIELPKFTKTETELETITDKWIYFLKNAGNLECVPDTLKIETAIEQAFEIANTASLSTEELELQEKRYDFIRLQRGAVAKALKQGLQQGLQDGKQEATQAIAKRLIQAGLDIPTIAKATDLTEVEVKSLML